MGTSKKRENCRFNPHARRVVTNPTHLRMCAMDTTKTLGAGPDQGPGRRFADSTVTPNFLRILGENISHLERNPYVPGIITMLGKRISFILYSTFGSLLQPVIAA